jgi:Na+-translocating ferredoxin:NAD+ oxidoreductase subunit B
MTTRRNFIHTLVRGGILSGLTFFTGLLVFRSRKGGCTLNYACENCPKAGSCDLPEAKPIRQTVWQLDPAKCIQCGRCATSCVMSPSAVKCFHVYAMCGYCDLCGGYFKPETKNLTTAAEHQLCPTNAIKRKFIEDPFFEYTIDKELCIGCAKCVKGCGAFGNGSLQIQVDHSRCLNCNECSIARVCPSEAFSLVPAGKPYLLKGFDPEKLDVASKPMAG